MHTKFFARRHFTQNNFYTANFFPHRNLDGQIFSMQNNFNRQMVFTQKIIRTEVLRTQRFAQNIFYIQTFLCTDAFARKTNCTQKLVNTAHFYMQPIFTQRDLFPLLHHLPFVFPLSCLDDFGCQNWQNWNRGRRMTSVAIPMCGQNVCMQFARVISAQLKEANHR